MSPIDSYQVMARFAMPAFMGSFSPDHGNNLGVCAYNVVNCLNADPRIEEGREKFVGNLGQIPDAVRHLGGYEGKVDFVVDNVTLPGGGSAASYYEVLDAYRTASPDDIKTAQAAIATAARGVLDPKFRHLAQLMEAGEAGIPPARPRERLLHEGLGPDMLRILIDKDVISPEAAQILGPQILHNLDDNIGFLQELLSFMPIRGKRAFVIGFSSAVSISAFCLGAWVVPGVWDSAMTLGIVSALIAAGFTGAEISLYRETRKLRDKMELPPFPHRAIDEMLVAQHLYATGYERVFEGFLERGALHEI